MSDKNLFLNISLIGACKSGKTSLIKNLYEFEFNYSYKPTQSIDFYIKEYLLYDYKKIYIKFYDIGSTINIREIAKKSHGFILVYDVTDFLSFGKLKNYLSILNEIYQMKNYPSIIVANKFDLFNPDLHKKILEKGNSLADRIQTNQIKTSVKKEVGIKEMFKNIIEKCANFHLNITPESIAKEQEEIKLEDIKQNINEIENNFNNNEFKIENIIIDDNDEQQIIIKPQGKQYKKLNTLDSNRIINKKKIIILNEN